MNIKRTIIAILVVYLYTYSVAKGQIGKLADLFEYQVEDVRLIYNPNKKLHKSYPPTGNNEELWEQFKKLLTARGKQGWELPFEPRTQIAPLGNDGVTGQVSVLTCTLYLKKKVYSTQAEIKKMVAEQTRAEAKIISARLMERINEMTWTEMGNHYKKDIADEIKKSVAEMLQESEDRIIKKLEQ